jgi:hypothetical protein
MKRVVHYSGQGYSFGEPTGSPPGEPACGSKATTVSLQPSKVTCLKCRQLFPPSKRLGIISNIQRKEAKKHYEPYR